MPELIKPKRTYRVGSKVFLTPEFKEKVRANRKKLNENDYVRSVLGASYNRSFEHSFWEHIGHSGRFF